MAAVPSGHVNVLICSPSFMYSSLARTVDAPLSVLAEEVLLGGHDHVRDDRARPTGNSAPRMSTTGCRLVLPLASSAVEASWSATATTVDFISRPSVSTSPRRSARGAKPETPSATSVMPSRQGRPKESETTTPMSTPSSSRMA